MNQEKLPGRKLKSKVLALLKSTDPDQGLQELANLPSRQVINPLFSYLMHGDQEIKWRAVTAIGVVVANLAEMDMESARVLMRRLMWSLNEESGGVGWGAPEALGEIMACHEGLAGEYIHMLLSYIVKDRNFLEHPWLQQGALWGLGRVAQTRPCLLQDHIHYILPFLSSMDPVIRGLAAWTIGLLGRNGDLFALEELLSDDREIKIYLNRKLVECRVRDLARGAMAAILEKDNPPNPKIPDSETDSLHRTPRS
jgi:HEAT repeat protein